MSDRNNSDGMRGCFNWDNSGNTVDPSSSGNPKKQHSSANSMGKGATHQPASNETAGQVDTKTSTPRPADSGRNEAREKTSTSTENTEKINKKAKTDEVQNSKPTHSASGESSSNRPSQGSPMYTSNYSLDASSSGTRSKPGIQLGPTYPIQNLKKMQDFSAEFDKKLMGHRIMIDMKYFERCLIVPYERTHVWDSNHVKLPHLYPRSQSHNKAYAPPSRWEATYNALLKLTKGSNSIGDVETAIMSYNSNNKGKWTFDALYHYGQRLHKMENNLSSLIPKMAKLALELPALIKQPIPLLRPQQNQAITMSQQQISCLLANAFFCTFPHRNNTKHGSEYANFPTINFSSLFANERLQDRLDQKVEKLRAIFHYFDTVTKESHDQDPASTPDGLVSFERICIPKMPDWNKQKMPLRNLHISAEGSIEHEGTGMLQVDFASKYIGGGVLGSGLVQEEILFLMCPELIVARLFTEKLADNECLMITGPQMYSLSSGYSRSFSWGSPNIDRTKRDTWKRRYRQIVAIDALEFKNPKDQYTKENITRELNKAFVGFQGNPKTAIATGNWGCGAFKGDSNLKALIQLMAAAAAERDMAYFAFGNKTLASEVWEMHAILTKNNVTVDKLYKWLKEYCQQYTSKHHSPTDVYGFIKLKIGHMASLL
ncbi:poly(ADP-ribose) glycohydrolase [Garra rufa]|uniref:poly(ADP-ribose) glycohydrolase n=1 Tax=Garra rufa TaxID=137080 RepID=UPI003CCEDC3A